MRIFQKNLHPRVLSSTARSQRIVKTTIYKSLKQASRNLKPVISTITRKIEVMQDSAQLYKAQDAKMCPQLRDKGHISLEVWVVITHYHQRAKSVDKAPSTPHITIRPSIRLKFNILKHLNQLKQKRIRIAPLLRIEKSILLMLVEGLVHHPIRRPIKSHILRLIGSYLVKASEWSLSTRKNQMNQRRALRNHKNSKSSS